MKWKIPPKSKIYEALGAIGDERIKVSGENAQVFSSSGSKHYSVTFDSSKQAIMCNDNNSYYQGYLGYPAIAFLLATGKIKFNPQHAKVLKSIKWKDLNQKLKKDGRNDPEGLVTFVKNGLLLQGVNVKELETDVDNILSQIVKLDLNLLGEKTKPPTGY